MQLQEEKDYMKNYTVPEYSFELLPSLNIILNTLITV